MIDWQAVNQTITFQIWSSLGLGGAPKSQPLRITGGNSLPNPTLGTPRMTTVWYQNWITGDDANHDADFKAPNFGGRFCLNVGSHMDPVKLEEFFGHPVTSAYTFSSDFHKRAHYLLHAKPSVRDLHRAGRAKPGQAFTAGSFEDAMHKLNEALKADKDLRTERCSNFSTPLLHDTQRALFDARSPDLANVYRDARDTRHMRHANLQSLRLEQARHAALDAHRPDLAEKARDGACHEMVMWYIHHLTESAREDIKSRIVLPLLPSKRHQAPAAGAADAAASEVHDDYSTKISCAVCHVGVGDELV